MAQAKRKPKRSQVSVKTAAVVSATVLGVALAAWLTYAARVTLTLILVSGLIAIALHHGVDFLQRHRVKKRGLAIAIVLCSFFAVLTGFALLIIPPAVKQGRTFVDQAPQMVQQARHSPIYQRIDRRIHIDKQLNELQGRSGEMASGAAGTLLKALGGIISGLAGLVTILFVTVFMLVFAPRIIQRILAEATARRRMRYERLLSQIYRSVGGYLSGLSVICGCNATAATTFLAVTKVPFFLPLGILSGFSSMVPYVGPLVVGSTITLLVFATKGPVQGLVTAIYFTAYGQFEGNILAPLVFRRTVEINPLVTLLSILIGGDVAGVPGAILAVPVAATGQLVIAELLRVRRKRLEVPTTGEVAAAQAAQEHREQPPATH